MKKLNILFLIVISLALFSSSCEEENIDEDDNNSNSDFNYTILKSAYIYNNMGTLEPAWDLKNDQVVASNGSADNQYIISEEYGGSFTGRWKSNNGTLFVNDDNFDYNDFKDKDVIDAFNAGTPEGMLVVEDNDIVIAKKGETYYVIKVTKVDYYNGDCACANEGKIEFEYKKK